MIRMECNMTDMNPNAVLHYALENEIINLAYIQEQVEEMQKNAGLHYLRNSNPNSDIGTLQLNFN